MLILAVLFPGIVISRFAREPCSIFIFINLFHCTAARAPFSTCILDINIYLSFKFMRRKKQKYIIKITVRVYKYILPI